MRPRNRNARLRVARAPGFVMAVLPAHHKVSIEKLRAHIGCEKIRLATEDEFLQVCPDCAVGAEPPFGNLYGIYVELVRPQIGDFSIRP